MAVDSIQTCLEDLEDLEATNADTGVSLVPPEECQRF
jgi:hypothetical protein